MVMLVLPWGHPYQSDTSAHVIHWGGACFLHNNNSLNVCITSIKLTTVRGKILEGGKIGEL